MDRRGKLLRDGSHDDVHALLSPLGETEVIQRSGVVLSIASKRLGRERAKADIHHAPLLQPPQLRRRPLSPTGEEVGSARRVARAKAASLRPSAASNFFCDPPSSSFRMCHSAQQ